MKLREVKKYLIVDGYNVINSIDSLKEKYKEKLEDARDGLIDIITEYAEFMGYEAVIVFDAYRVKGVCEAIEKRGRLTVVYTKEYQTADSYIEKFIAGLSRFDEIYVVTDDYAEQQIILGKGASRISTRELKLDLEAASDLIKRKNSINRAKTSKNRIEDNIDRDIFLKLEKIRRQK